MTKPFVIALLGAESTGKSTLALQLGDALTARGHAVHVVPEYLREWCDAKGRVPLQNEQADIANQQSQRIGLATTTAVVIADTTALMTAVYSDYLFNDQRLYADALAVQKSYDLTLLMGLDIEWVADGLQRDGPHVRDAVDALIRQALQKADIAAPTMYGLGDVRLQASLDMALQSISANISSQNQLNKRATWKHFCDCCGDGECERQLFGDAIVKS
jgi:HTH-type transcriptional regulator, transcriptional repressor of NAD biosynthesis genes